MGNDEELQSKSSVLSPFAVTLAREFEPAKPYAAPLLHIIGACLGAGGAQSSTDDLPIDHTSVAEPRQFSLIKAPSQPKQMTELRASIVELAGDEPARFPEAYLRVSRVDDPASMSATPPLESSIGSYPEALGGAGVAPTDSDDAGTAVALVPQSLAALGSSLPPTVRERVLMVGDTIDDMETAWRSGALSCLVADRPTGASAPCEHYVRALDMADLVVDELDEVVAIARGEVDAWEMAAARAYDERKTHGRFLDES